MRYRNTPGPYSKSRDCGHPRKGVEVTGMRKAEKFFLLKSEIDGSELTHFCWTVFVRIDVLRKTLTERFN